MNDYASSAHAQPLARAVLPIAVLTILWGCNWPMLKIGVTELAPLTFRAMTLPFAALGLLLVAWLSGDNVRIPRRWWSKVAILAAFNITGWNGFVLFGVQQMPAGRSAILAFTMPIWATLIASVVLHERISRRKLAGLLLGMSGMALLIGDEIRIIQRAPFGTVMILMAAITWGIGTVLMRKWAPAVPLTTVTGWMMLAGGLPIVALAPFFDAQPLTQSLASLSGWGWMAVFYNIVLAGTIAHWAWFSMARRLPVAVSSLSSLPVPVVGVFAGILLLHERPGLLEWLALGLVVFALFFVLFEPRERKPSAAAPLAPDE